MKKFIHIIIILLTVSSCSKVFSYRQIGTLSSDNVKMTNSGAFEYSNSGITISYNFWSEGGNVSFVITNNTDKDIYLLKDICYFIQNGWAYDYYLNRTYIESSTASSSVAQTYGASVNANSQLSGQLSDFAKWKLNSPFSNINYSSSGISYGASRAAASTLSHSSQSGFATETPEQKTVCIPAHSSKHFSDFNISTTPHRQCGFARDAQTEDGEKISFTSASNSPQTFENRLVFNINGEIVPIVNKFYVSEYLNILDIDKYAYIQDYRKDCNGKNIDFFPDVKIYKHAATNCFYTTYQCTVGVDNDRGNANTYANAKVESLSSNNKEGERVMYKGTKCVVISINGSTYTLAAIEYVKKNWADAIEYCHSFGADWRLPSKEEIFLLGRLNAVNADYAFWINSEVTESKAQICSYPAAYTYKANKNSEYYTIPITSVDINTIR